MAGESGSPLSTRVVHAAGRFGKGYLNLAQREARRDIRRLLAAGVSLAFAAVLFGFGLAAVEVCVGLLLWERGATPLEAVTLVAVANLAFALIGLVRARVLLSRPMLRESRELITDTWAALVA